jgi:site-specific recombinase XerD
MSTLTATKDKSYKLPELISYFELCNRAEGKSPKTTTWYSENLTRFSGYLQNRHLPDSIEHVDIKLLRDYVLYLLKKHRFEDHPSMPAKAEPLSTYTIHGHVRTLRAFFNWLTREGLIQNNPARDLRPPKVIKRVISTLSDEEIVSIFHTFNLTINSEVRNQTIFMLLLDTGLRIGELVNLKIEDVNLSDGLLKVMGKGKKERIVPIGSNAQRALQRYLFRNRPKPDHPGIENVFLSVHGQPLTENSMKLAFARIADRSGVLRLHAHLCRHTFATRYLLNGGDIFSLKEILGHTTLEMVNHYLHFTSSQIMAQHHKYSPMDKLQAGWKSVPHN